MSVGVAAGQRAAGFVARVAVTVVLAAVVANLMFNAAATALGYDYPYSTFLFLPGDRFADFFKLALSYPGAAPAPAADRWGMDGLIASYQAAVEQLRGSTINHFHVPPLPTLFGLTARAVMQQMDPAVLFLLLLAVALAGLFVTVLRLSPAGAAPAFASLALLSYPALFAIDRGHFFSLVTAICLIGGTLRTLRDGRADGWTILLFAIALNIRPNAGLVPLMLFLCRRGLSLRSMAALAIATLALFFISLAAAHQFYPAYTLASFRSGLRDYALVYIAADLGYPYGSSLYGMLRVLIGKNEWSLGFPVVFAAVLTGAAILASWRGLLKPSELLFLTLSAYALGSQVFADYHLIVFLIPLLLLASEGIGDRSGWAILLGSCFVLAPKNYAFAGMDHAIPWSWQIIANPLVLTIACAAVLATSVRRGAVSRAGAGSKAASLAT